MHQFNVYYLGPGLTSYPFDFGLPLLPNIYDLLRQTKTFYVLHHVFPGRLLCLTISISVNIQRLSSVCSTCLKHPLV